MRPSLTRLRLTVNPSRRRSLQPLRHPLRPHDDAVTVVPAVASVIVSHDHRIRDAADGLLPLEDGRLHNEPCSRLTTPRGVWRPSEKRESRPSNVLAGSPRFCAVREGVFPLRCFATKLALEQRPRVRGRLRGGNGSVTNNIRQERARSIHSTNGLQTTDAGLTCAELPDGSGSRTSAILPTRNGHR